MIISNVPAFTRRRNLLILHYFCKQHKAASLMQGINDSLT